MSLRCPGPSCSRLLMDGGLAHSLSPQTRTSERQEPAIGWHFLTGRVPPGEPAKTMAGSRGQPDLSTGSALLEPTTGAGGGASACPHECLQE